MFRRASAFRKTAVRQLHTAATSSSESFKSSYVLGGCAAAAAVLSLTQSKFKFVKLEEVVAPQKIRKATGAIPERKAAKKKFDISKLTENVEDVDGHQRVYMWGSALSMPVRVPPTVHCKLPVRVSELEKVGQKWSSIDFGPSFGVAINDQGEVWCWGRSTDKHFKTFIPPTKYEGLPKIIKASCTADDIILLAEDGRIYRAEYVPVAIEADGFFPLFQEEKAFKQSGFFTSSHQVIDIESGKNHTLFLTKGGKVFAAGSNMYGQCGRYVDIKKREPSLTNIGRDTPLTEEIIEYWEPHEVEFPSMAKNVKKIVAGGKHSVAMDENGHVFSWGDDSSIQLGLGDTRSAAGDKRHAYGLATYKMLGTDLPAGENKAAVKYNYYTPHFQSTPVSVQLPQADNRPDPFPAPEYLAAGEDFSIVGIRDSPEWYQEEDSTNLMFCCGHNSLGQCGRNMQQQMQTFSPVRVPRRSFSDQVTCGMGHCVSRLSDGSIFGWGDNRKGQVGLGHKSPTECAVRLRLEPEDLSEEKLKPRAKKAGIQTGSTDERKGVKSYLWGQAAETPQDLELFRPKKSKAPPCPGGVVKELFAGFDNSCCLVEMLSEEEQNRIKDELKEKRKKDWEEFDAMHKKLEEEEQAKAEAEQNKWYKKKFL
eukprot:gene428-125_t